MNEPKHQDKPAQAQPERPEDARSFVSFLTTLEDGMLNADLSKALQELNAAMNNHCQDFGGKSKGSLTIKLDFVLDKGVFDIFSDFKVSLPKTKRARTVAWSTPGNNFTPHNPKQMQLFGVRDVSSVSAGDIRSV